MSLIDIWIMQELAVVMAKHGYRPTEEEAETVLKIRRGRSHRVHLQAHFLHSSHLLHVCPPASDGTCVLKMSSCSVTEISKMRAGLMGGALTYGLSGLTRLRHHRYARPHPPKSTLHPHHNTTLQASVSLPKDVSKTPIISLSGQSLHWHMFSTTLGGEMPLLLLTKPHPRRSLELSCVCPLLESCCDYDCAAVHSV